MDALTNANVFITIIYKYTLLYMYDMLPVNGSGTHHNIMIIIMDKPNLKIKALCTLQLAIEMLGR